MHVWQALLLGFIQGVTEFLPVSSSGHLVIAQQHFQLINPPVFFDILLHLSTLAAVIIYFRHRLISLTKPEIIRLLIASVPVMIIGIIITPYEKMLFSSLPVVIIGLFLTGSILLLTAKIKPEKHPLNSLPLTKTLAIGIAQALAIIPGISRSGSTIGAGLMLGLKRSDAVAFSFILSIPAILGAGLFASLRHINNVDLPLTHILAGCSIAFITGLLALSLLDKIVSQAKIHYFGYYCLLLALILFLIN